MVCVERDQRHQPGRDRVAPAPGPCADLAADGPRGDQRHELGVLLPGRGRHRPPDGPEVDAPERERDPSPRAEQQLDRRGRARRARRGRDEPRYRGRGRRGARSSSRRSSPRSSGFPASCAWRRRTSSPSWQKAGGSSARASWLWVIVLQFGFVNAIEQGTEGVLGPAIAKDHFGGAAGWGFILTAQSLGLLVGGLILLRLRPRRLLLTAHAGLSADDPVSAGSGRAASAPGRHRPRRAGRASGSRSSGSCGTRRCSRRSRRRSSRGSTPTTRSARSS